MKFTIDKLKVRCYNCQGIGYFTNECRNSKERPKNNNCHKVNVTKGAETSLLIVIEKGDKEVLMQ